jgi:16S rRNA (guanine527-N7)-methyltransferase
VLRMARDLGFLGPGPVDEHLEHSRAFALAWPAPESPTRILDLGSGGGVPGLVLAWLWPSSAVVLLDGSIRRGAFLAEAIVTLALDERVSVVARRAEDAAHGPMRGAFDLVTARSFAPPAVTAECAAGFLRPDGFLIVAEPPTEDTARWPAGPLAQLGLGAVSRLTTPFHVQVIARCGAVPDRFPRRVGIPAKRPLWQESSPPPLDPVA